MYYIMNKNEIQYILVMLFKKQIKRYSFEKKQGLCYNKKEVKMEKTAEEKRRLKLWIITMSIITIIIVAGIVTGIVLGFNK